MRKKSVLILMSVLAFGIFTGAGQKSSYGPAAAARESSSGERPQVTQGSNYNTSNSGSGSQYSSGSGSGPGAYYNTNNSGDVSQQITIIIIRTVGIHRMKMDI
ncbi:hypothetical protein QYZ88_001135 [Lachnospiraceae bacterium C1.1]|nr:hypothetical protein [Lachnospiraceae bacterium C1.1]